MQKFTIVFKSGAKVDMEANNAKTSHNTLTGELTNFKYEGATKNVPLYVNLSEVAGIFYEPIPEEEEEDHENV